MAQPLACGTHGRAEEQWPSWHAAVPGRVRLHIQLELTCGWLVARAGTVTVFGALYYKAFARPAGPRRGGTPKRSLSGALDEAASAAKPGGAAHFDAEAQVQHRKNYKGTVKKASERDWKGAHCA